MKTREQFREEIGALVAGEKGDAAESAIDSLENAKDCAEEAKSELEEIQ